MFVKSSWHPVDVSAYRSSGWAIIAIFSLFLPNRVVKDFLNDRIL